MQVDSDAAAARPTGLAGNGSKVCARVRGFAKNGSKEVCLCVSACEQKAGRTPLLLHQDIIISRTPSQCFSFPSHSLQVQYY